MSPEGHAARQSIRCHNDDDDDNVMVVMMMVMVIMVMIIIMTVVMMMVLVMMMIIIMTVVIMITMTMIMSDINCDWFIAVITMTIVSTIMTMMSRCLPGYTWICLTETRYNLTRTSHNINIKSYKCILDSRLYFQNF